MMSGSTSFRPGASRTSSRWDWRGDHHLKSRTPCGGVEIHRSMMPSRGGLCRAMSRKREVTSWPMLEMVRMTDQTGSLGSSGTRASRSGPTGDLWSPVENHHAPTFSAMRLIVVEDVTQRLAKMRWEDEVLVLGSVLGPRMLQAASRSSSPGTCRCCCSPSASFRSFTSSAYKAFSEEATSGTPPSEPCHTLLLQDDISHAGEPVASAAAWTHLVSARTQPLVAG